MYATVFKNDEYLSKNLLSMWINRFTTKRTNNISVPPQSDPSTGTNIMQCTVIRNVIASTKRAWNLVEFCNNSNIHEKDSRATSAIHRRSGLNKLPSRDMNYPWSVLILKHCLIVFALHYLLASILSRLGKPRLSLISLVDSLKVQHPLSSCLNKVALERRWRRIQQFEVTGRIQPSNFCRYTVNRESGRLAKNEEIL